MGTIISLLVAWEKALEFSRERIPVSLRPTLEVTVGEIAGLGFVGLVLGSILSYPGVQKGFEKTSVEYFGEKKILIENFDYFSHALFQIGVSFFVGAGLMVFLGLKKIDDIAEVQDLQLDRNAGSADITAEKLAMSIPAKSFNQPQEQPGYVSIWRDVFMGKNERAAKTLLMRNLIIERYPYLPSQFRVEPLLEESFAQNMYRAVQISPLTWISFIPILALANTIDISHGVVNGAASNAAASVGFFESTAVAIIPAWFFIVLSGIWGYWNSWKMTQIKYMALPCLAPNPGDGRPIILPPPMYDDFLRGRFFSSPPSLQRVEKFWGKPPRTMLDDLFGQAGSAGLDLYFYSIKNHVWLNLAMCVFFGTQVFGRDLDVFFYFQKTAGNPSYATMELYSYGSFLAYSLFQLLVFAPKAFWNYCIVYCFDEDNLEDLLEITGYGRPIGGASLYDSRRLNSAEVADPVIME